MSECQALQRKNERPEKPDLLFSPSFQTDHEKTSKLPDKYTPFISCGSVSLVDSQVESPITILRDAVSNIGRYPSLMTALLQGVELGTFRVPLHIVHLKCGLVTGPVVSGWSETFITNPGCESHTW